MCEFGCGYALNWRIVSAEGQKEIDNAFANSSLFSLFVDVLVCRKVE
jgi:hypothetical protein